MSVKVFRVKHTNVHYKVKVNYVYYLTVTSVQTYPGNVITLFFEVTFATCFTFTLKTIITYYEINVILQTKAVFFTLRSNYTFLKLQFQHCPLEFLTSHKHLG